MATGMAPTILLNDGQRALVGGPRSSNPGAAYPW
jgi:hypothetical protein